MANDDPLANVADHLAEDHASVQQPLPSVLAKAAGRHAVPSTPPKQDESSSWLPRMMRRRTASASGAATAPVNKSADADKATAEVEASASFHKKGGKGKKKMLVPQALRTIADEKRAYKTTELSETLVWTTAKSFVGYTFFVIIFAIVAFSTRSPADYWANEGMKQLFVDGPFFFDPRVTHEKTLHDVHFVPQFYAWLEGPFLERIHATELGAPPRSLHGYNRIIGPVRLRQLRMQEGTCTVPPMFRSLIDECYAPYWIMAQSSEPYGPEGDPLLWTYSTSAEIDGLVSAGRFATYSGGGFVTDLPTNRTRARGTLEQLRLHGWVDRATRAVFVDFSCYNGNTETLISVRILFEFLATGGVQPYPILRVLHPLSYTSPSDFLRALFEFLFVTYTLFYIVQVRHLPRSPQISTDLHRSPQISHRPPHAISSHISPLMTLTHTLSHTLQEGREVRAARRSKTLGHYFGDVWNIVDWVVAFLSLAVVLLRLYVFNHVNTVRGRIDAMETDETYINLQPLMFQLAQVHHLKRNQRPPYFPW